MNARRRPRLFLDHKPPLVAFTVVAVACALMMVHMARSEASPTWLRAGLGGVVGQQVIAATVLEPDPASESRAVAAGPLPVAAAPGPAAPLGAEPAAGDPEPVDPGPAEHSPSTHGHHGAVAGVVVGEVVRDGGDAADPVQEADDSAGEDDSASHGHEGRGENPTPNVTAPDPDPAPQARDHQDWREEWVGDRGRGRRGAPQKGPRHPPGGAAGDHRHGPRHRAAPPRAPGDRGDGHGHGHGHGHDGGRGHH